MAGKRKYPPLKLGPAKKKVTREVQKALDYAEIMKLVRYLLQYRPAPPFGARRYKPADRGLAKKIGSYLI